MSKKEEAEYEEYESLKNSKFKQQKLPGWRPVPSMIRTTSIFFALGITFAGLGVLILLFSNNAVEYIERYDSICLNNKTCNITFDIKKKMNKNIMIYYQLDGFYQNHRRYMKSKSEEQFKGNKINLTKAKEDCDPVITNKQMGFDNEISPYTNKKMNGSEIAIPCGLMAKNYFNDTFSNWTIIFTDKPNQNIEINDTNIARKYDRENYHNINDNLVDQWINMTDEHFLVWMRPAPLPNFTKLYGRIEEDLGPDIHLFVNISNNYNVTNFNGAKYIILRTVNNFGGKNTMLAITYIIFGGICIILAIIFIIGYNAKAKKEK